jgi:hypothetical protein
MKGNKHMKTITNITYPAFALFAFACFAVSQNAQAVVPPPDGGYANQNTAEGTDALFSLTTGFENTAVGAQALYSLTTGAVNTALGFQALYNGITASGNTVVGDQALFSNIAGTRNVAVGATALQALTSGEMNTAVGNLTLEFGESVNFNTALGRRALSRTQGDQNTGLGFFAGSNLNGGTNNIYIGNAGPVPIGPESNTIRIGTQTATVVKIGVESHPMPAHTATFIAGISGVAVMGPAVHVSSSGQLGAQASSRRFKDDIKPMDKASEAILALEPVRFRYKREIDPNRTPQFGLIAEQVEKVDPALVARDADGKPYTVRYEAVNAMLLNEFLKEHRKLEQQRKDFEAALAQQQKQINVLTEGLQKVSAQLELSKFPPQTVANKQ